MNNIPEHIIDDQAPYSPAALLNTFSNSLASPLLNKQFVVKGIYKKGKGVSYSGFYYDILKDEFSDTNITLVIPERIRQTLNEGQLVEAQSYLTKRLSVSTGRMDVILNVSFLLSTKERIIDESVAKAISLLQQKAQIGYKDIDSMIKSKLYRQSPVKVTIIIGTTAIIDNDIKQQLKDASLVYDIKYVRANLTRVPEIIEALLGNDDTDILVVSRGGGENIQVFENLELAQAAVLLHSPFVTAIGHASDEPLLQKIADKHFITPTALGQYFYDTYHRSMDDLTNSKAKLISDLTKQIELNFQTKVQDLNFRLAENTKSMQELMRNSELKMRWLNENLSKVKSTNKTLFLLLALIIILVLFYLFFFEV